MKAVCPIEMLSLRQIAGVLSVDSSISLLINGSASFYEKIQEIYGTLNYLSFPRGHRPHVTSAA